MTSYRGYPFKDPKRREAFYEEGAGNLEYVEARDAYEELRLVEACRAGRKGKHLAINRLDLDSEGNPIGESND